MKSHITEPALLLRTITDFIEKTTREDQAKLVSGELEIALKPAPALKLKPRTSAAVSEIRSIQELVVELSKLSSRKEGLLLLEESSLTRKNINMIARQLDLPVRRDDNIERLADRIIEYTIGSRLNSQAIRGDN